MLKASLVSARKSMDPRTILRNLPSLSTKNSDLHSKSCKVCGGAAPFFDVVDFNKCHGYVYGPSGVAVSYFRCLACGFLFTDFTDDWTVADFGQFIYNDDLSLVDVGYEYARPRQLADSFAELLAEYKGCRFLDYGAGSGLFAQHMRNAGFNFEAYDPVSLPERPAGLFDVITCFEVIEHSPRPMETIANFISFLEPTGGVVFSQCLQPEDIEQLRCNWWYASPRNGHVSLYTDTALALIADRAGLDLYSGGATHCFCYPGSPLEAFARRVGAKVAMPQLLGAPLSDDEAYHGVEGSRTTGFRWTALDELRWIVQLPDGQCKLRVPFQQQIVPDFAERCRLFVDGTEVQTVTGNSEIWATISRPESGISTVTIRTPPLLRPRDVNGHADDRLLGLAINITPTA
ncbi:class I SAM-dependent methyltransferase [Sphingomonas paeninsulae]|uniref:Class I SAM-dependent methyltransferase n=2 Tax=Sphingomonas paeninsulae TaxID=2319844 RepID=A0A494TJE4_SPHPE|nr:class I SAM-dependent methyltransferase [Sphingomonas paeninsulae]